MIKWISDYLGTASHGEISADAGLRVIDVRDLVDKSGNSGQSTRAKIDEAIACLESGLRVVVCCDYGISRSNAIAAGIVARHEQLSFNDALRKVMATTGERDLKVEVLAAVRSSLGEAGNESLPHAREKRILVTGGSGFIGKALVERISEHQQIFAPSRGELDLVTGAADADLYIREQGVTHLVHLANPRVYTTTKAMGESLVLLENVLLACKQNGVKLIYLSSWEIYSGYRAEGLLADASLPPFPKGVYGMTKYLCETLIENHHSQSGLAYVLLRSSPVYGSQSDKPKFIFNFLRKAQQDEDIVTHRYLNGFPRVDLLYIDDLIAALLAAIERDISGALNVGSGNNRSTAEIAGMIIELTGSKSSMRHNDIAEYSPNVIMDNSRAAKVLDWNPSVDIEAGLRLLTERDLPGQ